MVTEVVKKGRMVFMNHYKLLEGEEVTIDYGHKPDVRFPFQKILLTKPHYLSKSWQCINK